MSRLATERFDRGAVDDEISDGALLTLANQLAAQKEKLLSGWSIDSEWLKSFVQLTAGVDVVTFDVFDTALTRSVEAPVDVWVLAERALSEKFGSVFSGFAQMREQAEKQARRDVWEARNSNEVTYQEILGVLVRMSPTYAPFRSDIEDTEITLERGACFGVPEIREAVRISLEAGRHVYFVSDMYLSAGLIQRLLSDAGYPDGIEVLVSSETGCTKATGTQWAVVVDRAGVPPSRILHVGDDAWSDVAAPRAKGFQAIAFTKVLSNKRHGGPLAPAVMPFSISARDAQLRRAQDNRPADPTSTMCVLGRSWGVIVLGAYIRWIAERARQIGVDRLFFCARDGWLVQRAWNASGLGAETGIPSSYLYISRKSLNIGAAAIASSPKKLSDDALNVLVNTYGSLNVIDILTRAHLTDLPDLMADATKTFGSLRCPVASVASGSLQGLIQRHSASIYPILQAAQVNALTYLSQEGFTEGKIGIIDIGWHGTMQTSINRILRAAGRNPMLYGFYCGLWPAAQGNRDRAGWLEGAFGNDFVPFDQQCGLQNSVAILENLLSSPEGTTTGYRHDNGRMVPILADATKEKRQHRAMIGPFQDATVEAIEAIFVRGDYNGLSRDDLTLAAGKAALARLSLSPSVEEMNAVGSIEHSSDFAHTIFEPLIPAKTGQNPQRSFEIRLAYGVGADDAAAV